MRITSDGMPHTIKLYDEEGNLVRLHYLTKIEILPIAADGGFITAKLTIENVKLDLIVKEVIEP